MDLRDLNRVSLKDRHPLSSMEQILQYVSRAERFSLLDGYSGYNKILVKEEDQLKTTFTTKRGTMTYKKMPFGLSNAGETFQKAMEMAFNNLMYKFFLVYLDDITIYSQKVADHINHLKKIFEHCKEFGISLNPKKCIFCVHEGKFLVYVVSKEGITVDPK